MTSKHFEFLKIPEDWASEASDLLDGKNSKKW